MHSNQYTLLFTSVLTIILASLLSVAAGSLDQIQKLNVEIDSKKNILSSLGFKESDDEKWEYVSYRPRDTEARYAPIASPTLTGTPKATAYEENNMIEGREMIFLLDKDRFVANNRVRMKIYPKDKKVKSSKNKK